MNWICFWWPRCLDCGKRKPEFTDALCFECAYAAIERKSWDAVLAAVQGVPKVLDVLSRLREIGKPEAK